jgi:acyl-CoA synthetase (NDP forming)
LSQILPDYGTASNPLDVTGGVVAKPQLFEDALVAVGDDPNIAMVGVVQPLPASEDHRVGANRELLKALGRGFKRIPIPGTLVNQAVTPVTDVGQEAITEAELPHVIGGLNTFIAAAARIFRWSRHLDAKPAPLRPAATVTGQRPSSEIETLRYLQSKGVPTIPFELVEEAADAASIASKLGEKLVVKIASPDIQHKTEAGGVILNVAPDEAAQAVDTVLERARAYKPGARIDGALIAPMRQPALEFVVGIARDPQWGPVLAVGLGGIWVEVMQDVQLRLAGVDAAEIAKALRSLRASKLLDGYRSTAPVDVDRLAQVIQSIAAAALDLGPDLAALEINPLRVAGDEIEALDALAIWN